MILESEKTRDYAQKSRLQMPFKNSTSGAGLTYGIASLSFASLLLAGVFAFKVALDFVDEVARSDKKEKEKFTHKVYKDIQVGSVAKSYTFVPFLIY
jgi:hypothetical protein